MLVEQHLVKFHFGDNEEDFDEMLLWVRGHLPENEIKVLDGPNGRSCVIIVSWMMANAFAKKFGIGHRDEDGATDFDPNRDSREEIARLSRLLDEANCALATRIEI